MGDFNLPNKDWAQGPTISTATFCETERFLTAKNFTQLITEPTHIDCKVLDLVFTNYDGTDVLYIQFCVIISAYLWVSLKSLKHSISEKLT